MSSGYFNLMLDTTGPEISIAMPHYSSPEAETYIYVKGSETLSTEQHFYFIDSKGTQHDVIFDYQGDQFYGEIVPNNFSFGIATFYAQVWDKVNNPSAFINQSINILQSAELNIKVNQVSRDVITQLNSHSITNKLITRNQIINQSTRNLSDSKKIMAIGGGIINGNE